MAEAIAGLRKLERKLERLARKSSPKVGRAAMTAMATPLKQAIRRGVNGSNASDEMKRAAKQTIGSQVGKVRILGEPGLKVGFGVGKQSKARSAKATARAGGKRRGVGISSRNIQWPVFGTGEKNIAASRGAKSRATRETRVRKSGGLTGSTKPVLDGVIEAAILPAVRPALKKAAVKVRQVLRKEARKRR